MLVHVHHTDASEIRASSHAFRGAYWVSIEARQTTQVASASLSISIEMADKLIVELARALAEIAAEKAAMAGQPSNA